MEQPVEQPCYFETSGCVKGKKRTRSINILIMKIYDINLSNISKPPNVDQSVHNCFEKILYSPLLMLFNLAFLMKCKY